MIVHSHFVLLLYLISIPPVAGIFMTGNLMFFVIIGVSCHFGSQVVCLPGLVACLMFPLMLVFGLGLVVSGDVYPWVGCWL